VTIQKELAEETNHTQPVSLKWDEVEKELKKEIAEGFQQAKPGTTIVTAYKADNHGYDKSRLGNDELFSLINKHWIKRLENDIYIEEAYRILNDYITMTNTKN